VGGLGGGWTYYFKGVCYYPDSHKLLAVIASVHHERICETLNDWTLGFAETLNGIAASGVRDVDGGTDLDVVATAEKHALASKSSRNDVKPLWSPPRPGNRAPPTLLEPEHPTLPHAA